MKSNMLKNWINKASIVINAWKISTKLTVAVALLLLVSLFFVFLIFQYTLSATAEDLGIADLDHQAINVLRTCQNRALQTKGKLDGLMREIDLKLELHGGIYQATKASWNTVNQFSGERRTVELPVWYVNGEKLLPEHTATLNVFENTEALKGNVYAVFQRINGEGDFMCVATSIDDEHGKKVTGTYIPARDSEHPKTGELVEAILHGKSYRGEMFTLNDEYIGAYVPLLDRKRNISGMVFVGTPAWGKGAEEKQQAERECATQADLVLGLFQESAHFISWEQAPKQQWNVEKKGSKLSLPTWYLGSDLVAPGKNILSAIAAKTEESSDCVCSFYQKSGDNMYCIATSEKKASARIADNFLENHKASAAVIKGKSFEEVPCAKNNYRYTVYQPLKDGEKVVGMVSLGFGLKDWLEKLGKLEVGADGNAIVFDGNGAIAVHPHLKGKNILEVKDADGDLFGKDLLDAVSKLKEEKLGKFYYDEASVDREKLVKFTHFSAWKWTVGVEGYDDKLSASAGSKWLLFFVWLIITAATIYMGMKISRAVFAPLQRLKACMEGKISKEELSSGDDEFSEVMQAFFGMVTSLKEPVRKIQRTLEITGESLADAKTLGKKVVEQANSTQSSLIEASSINRKIQPLAKKLSESLQSEEKTSSRISHLLAELTASIDRISENAQGQIEQSQKTSDLVRAMGNIASIAESAQAQAASAVETSASTEEMTVSIRNVAQNAQQAMAQAKEALKSAEEGGQSVDEAVAGMKGIAESSEKMSEIIGVVSDISEQTNLLALNAAIEAARAGVYGKGFAVVAAEVQNLAERSADAANEISHLIRTNAKHAEAGNKLIMKASKSLDQILKAIRETNEMVTSISQATIEQEAISAEVLRAMENLAQLTNNITTRTREQVSRREDAENSVTLMKGLVGEISRASEQQLKCSDNISRNIENMLENAKNVRENSLLEGQYIEQIDNALNKPVQSVEAYLNTVEKTIGVLDRLSNQMEEIDDAVQKILPTLS